jgi:hypothetical protein
VTAIPSAAPGGPAALRGFRLQSLYALHRLLTPSAPDETIKPEGDEDLAIYTAGNLDSYCQVKALAAPLALSDLEPSGGDGFFSRLAARLSSSPALKARVVSFGPVGHELEEALAGREPSLSRVVTKLRRAGLQPSEARRVLDATALEIVDEEDLKGRVAAATSSLLTGHDPNAAADLLLLWIHLASEERRLLSRDLVVARMTAVGRYLAERASYAAEWFTTIRPIEEMALTQRDRERLQAEFANGVSARFEHVVAGAAIRRDAELYELDGLLRRSRVVVIRGESGAGKTTLALEYLAGLPNEWRFGVADIESRRQAHSVARALLGHARALQVPLFVHLDVGPVDLDWPAVVADLVSDPEIRVLVTVREEDWQRTRLSGGFEYAELQLSLGEDEARGVYEALRERGFTSHPTFAEAWSRFGSQPGPLLEFVHLCSQGVGLGERLRSQVSRLRDEVREGRMQAAELDLLRIVSVASAYEGSVDLGRLVAGLALADPTRTVELFEREYLVRSSPDGRQLLGLHPVRSELLATELTDPVLAPWLDTAVEALPLMVGARLGAFLLFSFARRPRVERDRLLAELNNLNLSTWVGIAGVVRALLWVGIADYIGANAALFAEVRSTHPTAAFLMVDWDVARIGADKARTMLDELAASIPGFAPAAAAAAGIRARQTDPADIMEPCRSWLTGRHGWPETPTSGSEWSAFGSIAFWLQRLGIDAGIDGLIGAADWQRALETLSVTDLAEVGLGVGLHDSMPAWWTGALPEVMRRFQLGAGAIEMRDEGGVFGMTFIIDPEAEASGAAPDPHREAMWRIDLMRRLLPARTRYECQGHGHRLVDAGHDPTTKAIPADNLPLRPLSEINSIFRGLTELPGRPVTWANFWDRVLEQRQVAADAITLATRLVERHFRGGGPADRGHEISAIVDRFSAIGETTLLPRAAVDEWGFTSETSAQDPSGQVVPPGGALVTAYRDFWRSHREFWSTVDNLGRQMRDAMLLQTALGRRGNATPEAIRGRADELGVNEAFVRLSLRNLVDARTRRVPYARHTSTLIPPALATRHRGLLVREAAAFGTAVHVWRTFVESPSAVITDVAARSRRARDRDLRLFRIRLRDALAAAHPVAAWRVLDREIEYEGQGALVIVGDWPSSQDSLTTMENTCRVVSEELAELNESSRQLVCDELATSIIATLVRGRLVDAEAVVLATLSLAVPGYAPRWFSLVPRALDTTLIRSTRLRLWSDPSIHLGDGSLRAAVTVWARISHLSDLDVDASQLGDTGKAVADKHLDRMSRGLRADAQILGEETDAFGRLLESRGEPIASALRASSDRLLAAAAQPLTLRGSQDLVDRVQEVLYTVTLARTAWIDAAATASS